MLPDNFKLIPLLVFVAMLAFSFRLAEVVTGFSTLTGTAYALEEVDDEPPEIKEESHDGEQKDTKGKDPHKNDSLAGVEKSSTPALVFEEEEEEEEAEEEEDEEEDDPIEWRDASDSDLDYMEVRIELFKDLSKRRKEIEGREQQVMAREALLQAAEHELDRKYQELSQLRNEIEDLLQQQSDEEQTRVKSLVKIYEGMKPKDAARIFNTLDLDILVVVLSGMSERKLSPVLAAMTVERARTVTIMLAEQKQLPSLPQSN